MDRISDLETVLAAARKRIEGLEAALRLCIAWMPLAEVHSWPPGFRLRKEALAAATAALSSPAVTTGGLGKGKVEARCDWFGHDGEGAQCGERARFLVGSRHLCAEHSTVVRRSIHHPEGA